MLLPLVNQSSPSSHSHVVMSTSNTSNNIPVSCETLEAECNVLGMELLNVLEFIGDTIDYRKITLLVSKRVNSVILVLYSSFLGAKAFKFDGPHIQRRHKIKEYRDVDDGIRSSVAGEEGRVYEIARKIEEI